MKIFDKIKKLGEKGIVLPLVLSYSLVFTAQITGLAEYASHTQRLVQSQQNQMTSFYLAEAAAEKTVAAVRLYIAQNGISPSSSVLTTLSAAPNISSSGASYTTASVASFGSGGWTSKTLSSGDYSGLSASTQTVNIVASATDNKGGVTHNTTVSQTLEVQLIPIFQFGVFYQEDLEIQPGATMTFAGPVHTNGNLYVGVDSSTSSLSFQSSITAYGTILHARKGPGTLGTGAVNIEDSSGTYQNMYLGSGAGQGWLDSGHSSWATMSQTRWGGNVLNAAQDVKKLTLPLPSTTDYHTLIERRVSGESSQLQAEKMDYKANVRIIDGSILDQNGTTIELRYCSGGGTYNSSNNTCPGSQTVVNPVSTAQFYNFREGKTVKATDIDIAKLNSSPSFTALVNANNGVVVYFSDSRSSGSSTYQDSVRIINGSQLPTKGLTVASENPMFVKGSFNTTSKQPSGLVSDAFNILSGNWSDTNSTNTGLSGKTATATTINTTVITGNTDTTSGQYNGGFENIHRMHENWSGVNLTYSGSVIVLYNSTKATGNWVYGGNYYTAPNRIWSYDTSLSGGTTSIPGFPSVFNVAKAGYEAT